MLRLIAIVAISLVTGFSTPVSVAQDVIKPLPFDRLDPDSLNEAIARYEKENAYGSLANIYGGIYAYYISTRFRDSATEFAMRCEENALKAGDSAKYYYTQISIGELSSEARNYGAAKEYYMRALPYYNRLNNHKMLFHVYGSLGNIFLQERDSARSLYYDSLALEASRMAKDAHAEVILTDIRAQQLIATNKLDEGIQLIKENVNLINRTPVLGANAQLNIYWRGLQLNLLGKCYYLKKDYRSAISYSQQALLNDTGTMMSSYYIEANRTIANSFIQLGYRDSAIMYTNRFYEMAGEAIYRLDPEKMIEISEKYEAEKKQREIAGLKQKAELQQLKVNNQQKMSLAFAVILCLVVVIAYFIIVNVRNTRKLAIENAQRQLISKEILHQQREFELRNRISRDLHDDIGSTLSSIKAYSEILKTNPKHDGLPLLITENASDLMDRLEVIAWASNPQHDTFGSLTHQMLKYAEPLLKNRNINFQFPDNNIDSNAQIAGQVRQNLLLIFKEAINNVVKYSQAINCHAKLVIDDGNIVMTVVDDGIGLNGEIKGSGYGLRNMQKRASELNGNILFGKEGKPGTHITVKIPYPVASSV